MGQKRRLSVATALSSKADIILLDEPTFGLDSHNTFQLIELFQESVSSGQTIIMVTHDPEIIHRYPTRRLIVEDNQLIEDKVNHMFERWKKHYSFVDDVNIITKLLLGVALFIFIIFVHNFDYMIYITIIMFLFLMAFNGTQFKITGAFILATVLFALLSSLFMILYGDGTHMLFKWGIIQISTESIVRGLHLSLRTITVSMFGILLALTSEIVMIFIA